MGWRERCTIRAFSIPVDAVNGSGQQPRRTHEWLRHHRRSQRRTNPSRRSGAGSIPAHARGSGERYRLGGRCHGCPATSVGRWAGKRGGVLAAPWSVCGQWNSRNARNHGTHGEHFRRSEPCRLPKIELLKRVSPVRIRPGAGLRRSAACPPLAMHRSGRAGANSRVALMQVSNPPASAGGSSWPPVSSPPAGHLRPTLRRSARATSAAPSGRRQHRTGPARRCRTRGTGRRRSPGTRGSRTSRAR